MSTRRRNSLLDIKEKQKAMLAHMATMREPREQPVAEGLQQTATLKFDFYTDKKAKIKPLLSPQAFTKKLEYCDDHHSVDSDIEQQATAQLDKDMEKLKKILDEEFKLEFMERKDLEKVKKEKERSNHIKASALQNNFKESQAEDNEKFFALLE